MKGIRDEMGGTEFHIFSNGCNIKDTPLTPPSSLRTECGGEACISSSSLLTRRRRLETRPELSETASADCTTWTGAPSSSPDDRDPEREKGTGIRFVLFTHSYKQGRCGRDFSLVLWAIIYHELASGSGHTKRMHHTLQDLW